MISVQIDLQKFTMMLDKTRQLVKAPRGALMNAIKALDQRVRGTFRTNTDPWGQPWPELSEATLVMRLREGSTSLSPLNDTSVMFRSLEAGVDSDLQAHISIGGVDRFPVVHQFGNPSNLMFGLHPAPIPARPMFPIRPGGQTDLPASWAKDMMKPLDDALQKAIA